MKCRLLLINPAVNQASQNKVINAVINTTIPTSVGVLAGYVNSAGNGPVKIVDEQMDPIKCGDLEKLVLGLDRPRVVGISVLTINSKRAYELADMIKRIDRDTCIILGGIHPTVMPEEALAHDSVDVVVRGEGEKTLLELVQAISAGKSYRDTHGISFLEGGSVIHNPDRGMIMNLEELPPFPYHLFEENIDRYTSFGGILTSRGCPHGCIFCSSRSVSGTKYRYFSVERVVSEIRLLADKYGQKIIWMMDDNIAANHAQFVKLLEAIIREGLHKKVAFHGSMRGDNISEELLDKAKEANFKMISFGLETGSEALMKMINKGETIKEVVDAIKLTSSKGLSVATTIIFGLPTETRKDRWDALKLVKSLPLSSVRFNTLTPYPGTPAFEKLKTEGKVVIMKDWENFAVQYMWEGDNLAYVPDNTSRYQLMFDTMFANLSFYLSISGIRRMLGSSFAGGNVITVQGKWYQLPRTFYKMFVVSYYLVRRFTQVSFRMLIER